MKDMKGKGTAAKAGKRAPRRKVDGAKPVSLEVTEGAEKKEALLLGTETASQRQARQYREMRIERETARAEGADALQALPEEKRSKLFAWMRECPYDEAVIQVLRDEGLGDFSRDQLKAFFDREAEDHWERRIERAAVEANALVRLVERSPVKFSAGILAALGQETFRQISSGEMAPESIGKIATLFLRARSDERSELMQELRREKMQHELEGQLEQALEKLAEEVDKHPLAREAFEALRRELSGEKEVE